MFTVALFEPEIPPNTGNIIRLCANTGCALHLIEPLGFAMEDRLLRRAGLDYREWAQVRLHPCLEAFVSTCKPRKVWAYSTKGGEGTFATAPIQPGDALVFGPESRGLPQAVRDALPPDQVLRIPMVPGSRSLNLSNAVAVAVYQAWGRHGYPGAGG